MNAERQKANRQLWRTRINDWQESGLTKIAFCREHNLSEKQFGYYYRILVLEPARQQAGFAQISVKPAAGSGLRLRLNGALELELESDFDADTLRRFLAVASSAC